MSFVGTSIQLGLLLHAGVVMTPLKLASAISTRRTRHEGSLLGALNQTQFSSMIAGTDVGRPADTQ
jgi:hypothetical protein